MSVQAHPDVPGAGQSGRHMAGQQVVEGAQSLAEGPGACSAAAAAQAGDMLMLSFGLVCLHLMSV